jgi:hypothetical protein
MVSKLHYIEFFPQSKNLRDPSLFLGIFEWRVVRPLKIVTCNLRIRSHMVEGAMDIHERDEIVLLDFHGKLIVAINAIKMVTK